MSWSFLNSVRTLFQRRTARQKTRGRSIGRSHLRRQLSLELLEDRTCPSPLLVTTPSDAVSHSGLSLRDAVAIANKDASQGTSDTITFDASLNGDTITLSQGKLELTAGTGTTTIDGGGQISVSGGGQSGVFQVDSGAHAVLTRMTIKNGTGIVTPGFTLGGGIYNNGILTVSNDTLNGNSATRASGDADGGGIYNAGTLTVTTSTFTGNTVTCTGSSGSGSGNGGGIDNFGTLTVTGSTFSNNRAIFVGAAANSGAIGNENGGTATISGSTFSGNSAHEEGAITNSGQLTVSGSTFSGNSTSDSNGALSSGGTMVISGSTFSGNVANGGGGAIGVGSGTLTVSNCTLSGNSAGDTGGAIRVQGGTLTISNSTLTGNFDTRDSNGGIYLQSGAASLVNNIIVGNSDDIGGGNVNATASAYNLIGTGGSGGLTNGTNHNQVGVSLANAHLGALANNGGPTQTIALLHGSPAIGAGDPSQAGTPDQRGVTRTLPVSIGAYQGPPLPDTDTWTGLGSDNNWSNADNWQDSVAPTPGDTLVFPSGASQLVNNDDFPDGTSFDSIRFTGHGYDISGNAITLTSGITANASGTGTDTVGDNITLAANATFTVNTGTTLIVSGNLDGSGGLQLNGAGILDLAGTNTYSGVTASNQGKLLLAGSLDTNSTISVNNGANLETSGTLTLEQNASLNDQGALTVDAGGAMDDLGLVTVATTGVLTDSSSGRGGSAGVEVEQGAELNVQGALTVTAGGTLDDSGSVPVASTGSIVDHSSGVTGVAGVQVEQGAVLANQGTVQVTGTSTANAIIVVNGLMTGSLTVGSFGFLEGTGSVGNITASNGGTIVPGLIGRIGILNAQSVNLSNGGVLYIQISGYQTPGTDFSKLVTGNLVLGGTSKLTLDLSGLTTRGTVRGIVTDGGQTGAFGTVQVINNPFSFGDTVIYKNDSIDVTIF